MKSDVPEQCLVSHRVEVQLVIDWVVRNTTFDRWFERSVRNVQFHSSWRHRRTENRDFIRVHGPVKKKCPRRRRCVVHDVEEFLQLNFFLEAAEEVPCPIARRPSPMVHNAGYHFTRRFPLQTSNWTTERIRIQPRPFGLN